MLQDDSWKDAWKGEPEYTKAISKVTYGYDAWIDKLVDDMFKEGAPVKETGGQSYQDFIDLNVDEMFGKTQQGLSDKTIDSMVDTMFGDRRLGIAGQDRSLEDMERERQLEKPAAWELPSMQEAMTYDSTPALPVREYEGLPVREIPPMTYPEFETQKDLADYKPLMQERLSESTPYLQQVKDVGLLILKKNPIIRRKMLHSLASGLTQGNEEYFYNALEKVTGKPGISEAMGYGGEEELKDALGYYPKKGLAPFEMGHELTGSLATLIPIFKGARITARVATKIPALRALIRTLFIGPTVGIMRKPGEEDSLEARIKQVPGEIAFFGLFEIGALTASQALKIARWNKQYGKLGKLKEFKFTEREVRDLFHKMEVNLAGRGEPLTQVETELVELMKKPPGWKKAIKEGWIGKGFVSEGKVAFPAEGEIPRKPRFGDIFREPEAPAEPTAPREPEPEVVPRKALPPGAIEPTIKPETPTAPTEKVTPMLPETTTKAPEVIEPIIPEPEMPGRLALDLKKKLGREELGKPEEPPLAPEVPILDRVATVEVPVKDIKLSKDVPNFKAGADKATGIVPGKQLTGRFKRLGVEPIVIWRRKSGELEVITGRHKLDLARRTGEETIPAQIVDESEIYDKKWAMTVDAESNIRNEQGEVSDYAQYFKNTGITQAQAEKRSLLSRVKQNNGWRLGKDLVDDVYNAYIGNQIPENKALAIARGAPGNESAQMAALSKIKQYSPEELESFATLLANTERSTMAPEAQGGLFGFDDSAIRETEAVAKEVGKEIRAIKDRVLSVQGALKRPELARDMGLEFTDEPSLRNEVARLERRIEDLKRVHTNPELYNEMRQRAGLLEFEPETEAYAVKGKPVMGEPGEPRYIRKGEPAPREAVSKEEVRKIQEDYYYRVLGGEPGTFKPEMVGEEAKKVTLPFKEEKQLGLFKEKKKPKTPEMITREKEIIRMKKIGEKTAKGEKPTIEEMWEEEPITPEMRKRGKKEMADWALRELAEPTAKPKKLAPAEDKKLKKEQLTETVIDITKGKKGRKKDLVAMEELKKELPGVYKRMRIPKKNWGALTEKVLKTFDPSMGSPIENYIRTLLAKGIFDKYGNIKDHKRRPIAISELAASDLLETKPTMMGKTAGDPSIIFKRENAKQKIRDILSDYLPTERDFDVFASRILKDYPDTFEVIAKRHGISNQRAQEIWNENIKKLRKNKAFVKWIEDNLSWKRMGPAPSPKDLREMGLIWHKYFTTRRGVSVEISRLNHERSNSITAEIFKGSVDVKKLIKWLRKNNSPEVKNFIHDIVTGQASLELYAIPDEIKDSLRTIRARVDRLTDMILLYADLPEDTQDILRDNMGEYLIGRYRAWEKVIFKPDQKMKEKYAEYLRETRPDEFGHFTEKEMSNFLRGELNKYRKNRFKPKRSIAVSGELLAHKQKMPKAKRDYYGEIIDVPWLYMQTITKQASMAYNAKFLSKIATAWDQYWTDSLTEARKREWQNTRIPEDMGYGKLRNKYVAPELYDFITGIYEKEMSWTRKIIENFIVQPFKWNRTIAIPAGHGRNIFANPMFAILGRCSPFNPMNLPYYAKFTKWAIGRSGKYSDEWANLIRWNVVGTQYYGAEVGPFFGKLIGTDPLTWPEKIWKYASKPGKSVVHALGELWNFGDSLFRGAAFIKYTEAEGMSPQLAAEEIDRCFPNYKDLPAVVDFLRHVPIMGTFVSFNANVIKIFSNQVTRGLAEMEAGLGLGSPLEAYGGTAEGDLRGGRRPPEPGPPKEGDTGWHKKGERNPDPDLFWRGVKRWIRAALMLEAANLMVDYSMKISGVDKKLA